ncbi:hypothetical protein C6H63_08550 [Limosilactobacillus reuteri]|nr:hypothetical protein C6H63_08550 [Limosilactobacillus reuteri]
MIVNYLQQNNIDEYFFIRYWEGGPHVRIRVRKRNSITDKSVNRILRLSIQKFFKANPKGKDIKLDKNEFYKNSFTDGKEINIDDYPWYSNGEVIRKKYIPEIDRYGGEQMIGKSEKAFISSSQLVALMLEHRPSFGTKVSFLFAMFNCLINKIFQENKEDKYKFLVNSAQFWIKSRIKSDINNKNSLLWKQLDLITNEINTLPTLHTFLDDLLDIYQDSRISLKYRRTIIFSQFHMLANRLGVPISYELLFYQLSLERMRKSNE